MKLIPRLKPYYSFSEWLSILQFGRKSVQRLEKEFAEKFECRYGVMFSYGRTALYALFKVWNLQNAEIICPAYTCVVVQHSIVLSGNIPVFADCEEGSFNMSLSEIRRAVTEKTRAVVVTHLFGTAMDVNAVNEIVREAERKYNHKIYVIQDCAHSYGCRWNGELVTKFGDAAVFGMNISKIMNSVFGGMAITDSSDTNDKLLQFRKIYIKPSPLFKGLKRFLYFVAVNIAFNSYIYGFVNFLERKGFLNRFVKYYDESLIYFPDDWDVMPTDTEARVGLSQLKKYDKIIQERRRNALRIMDNLQSRKDILFFKDSAGNTYSHLAGIVPDRTAFVEEYLRKGIQLGILIEYSVPEMQSYQKYKRWDCPVSEYYSNHLVNLPVWPGSNSLKRIIWKS